MKKTYNWVGKVIEWLLSNGPDLKEDHPKTPDITGGCVLVVVQGLNRGTSTAHAVELLYRILHS